VGDSGLARCRIVRKLTGVHTVSLDMAEQLSK